MTPTIFRVLYWKFTGGKIGRQRPGNSARIKEINRPTQLSFPARKPFFRSWKWEINNSAEFSGSCLSSKIERLPSLKVVRSSFWAVKTISETHDAVQQEIDSTSCDVYSILLIVRYSRPVSTLILRRRYGVYGMTFSEMLRYRHKTCISVRSSLSFSEDAASDLIVTATWR